MKKILLVLIVLLGIFIPNKIYALEDSFYEDDYILNEYVVKTKDEYNEFHQIKMLRRKSDDRPVYNVELWNDSLSNEIMIGYDINQNKHINIEHSVWARLILIAYYGYGYQHHTDVKWYAITQFMIWETISPDSNIYFTDTLNGNKIIKYQEEINEINNLIEIHSERPSFSMKTFEINYKENFTIVDENNVLKNFIVKDPDRLTITKNKNELTVKSNYVKNSTVYLFNKGKIYDNYPIVYIAENGQDILLPGDYYPIYVSINFNVPVSNVTLNLLDNETVKPQGDAKFKGAKFQLLDTNKKIIQEKTIDENNKLIFENIGYGNYYIKEIETGEGYLLNNKMTNLKVDEDSETINYYNQVIKNKLLFQKYIKNPVTQTTKKESNAKFAIYHNNQKILTFETDENGYYEIELPYGTYMIKQESGIDEFEIKVLENNKVQTFELYSDEIIPETDDNFIFENDILTENETSDSVISDIVYKVENSNEIINEELPEINEEIIEVPNTFIKETILINIDYLLMALGLICIGIGKLNEDN